MARALPTAAQAASIEKAFGFRFPPAYLALLAEPAEFFWHALPRAQFLVAPAEVRRVKAKMAGAKLLPFLAYEEPAHTDYYCFDRATAGPDFAVVVFAIHTVVAGWATCSEWIDGLRQKSR